MSAAFDPEKVFGWFLIGITQLSKARHKFFRHLRSIPLSDTTTLAEAIITPREDGSVPAALNPNRPGKLAAAARTDVGWAMNDTSVSQQTAIAEFRRLHRKGCFVLPNPWDIGTALYLHHLGFKALATTSAGYAFSRGRPDGGVPCEEMLAHIREIAAATPLPVNADFLGGFADDPEGVAFNVRRCVATGVAGLSIEDSTGKSERPLYEKELAVERISAARRAIDKSGPGLILTGRCEAFLVQHPDPLRTSLARLVAYAEAGADCLYAPGASEPEEISAIVRAVAPRPVNILVSGFNSQLSLAQLADLGVRRISVGSGLALAAWGAVTRAAREIAADGTFQMLANGARSAELNGLFDRPA